MSGELAKRLYDRRPWPTLPKPTLAAGDVVIDGKKYKRIEDYIPVWEKEQKAKEKARKKQEEQQQDSRRQGDLRGQIEALKNEKEKVTGPFTFAGRMKIQLEISRLEAMLWKLGG